MYKYMWYFVIYAFLGWCLEVTYATIMHKKFVNRGFLNGPYCPIYGFGVVIIAKFLVKFNDSSLITLFFTSVLLSTALEFVTGFVLEKIFHQKWWDYSKRFLNINGYVCLLFSLLWGLGCTIVIKLLLPITDQLINIIPMILGRTVLILCIDFMILDLIATVITISGMRKPVKELQDIAKGLKDGSNFIGRTISKNTIRIKKKYDETVAKNDILKRRIIKAFPNLTKK